MIEMNFQIWDKQTNKPFDVYGDDAADYALKHTQLKWCNLFAVTIDNEGSIYLLDECGDWEYLPPDRFEIRLT